MTLTGAIVDVILMAIGIIEFLLIIWIILSWLISFNIINEYQPFVQKIYTALQRLFEPVLHPIRRFMPDLGGLDLSPIVLFLALQLLSNLVIVVATRIQQAI